MVGHCLERAKLAVNRDCVFVATCDREIFEYVADRGDNAVMTSDMHRRATTRTAEALETIEKERGTAFDIVVMVQGDEPLVPPEVIRETISHFENPSVDIVNIMSEIASVEAFEDPNNVKVVVNRHSDAMYFSRLPIPHNPNGDLTVPMYMQSGIIAFRRQTLIDFNAMDETVMEIAESIDMNRVIENGLKIRMVPTSQFMLGVDTLEEMNHVDGIMTNDPVYQMYKNTGSI